MPLFITICEDKRGMLWLGTNLDGVNKFDRDSATFTSYLNQGLALLLQKFLKIVRNIFGWEPMQAGYSCWTRKTNTFKKFSEKDGLIYNGVLSINEDNVK